MNRNILKISMSCRNNPECIFNGEEIILDIVLTNIASHDIGLPLSYLRRRGVSCVLIDNRTNKKFEMGVPITPPSLRREFVRISPRQEVKLVYELGADLIGSIGDKRADFTAVLRVGSLLELKEGDEPMNFTEEAKIHIHGMDIQRQ